MSKSVDKIVISTPHAPAAIGPYSQAIESGGFIFTSGQIPIDPQTGDLVNSDIKAATIQVLNNLKAILEQAGSSLDQVVKTTVLLKDLADFAAVNEVYATYFTEDQPARACFQVGKLPLDSLVEIDAVAKK